MWSISTAEGSWSLLSDILLISYELQTCETLKLYHRNLTKQNLFLSNGLLFKKKEKKEKKRERGGGAYITRIVVILSSS